MEAGQKQNGTNRGYDREIALDTNTTHLTMLKEKGKARGDSVEQKQSKCKRHGEQTTRDLMRTLTHVVESRGETKLKVVQGGS